MPLPPSFEQLMARRNEIRQDLASTTLGDLRPGSLKPRYRKCGKPNCHCAREGDPGHGPKWVLSREVKGSAGLCAGGTPALPGSRHPMTSSPAPLSRFQSPLSEPDVRFSRISALQWDHASRTQVPGRSRGRLLWDWHPSPTPSTSARGLPPGLLTPRRRHPHQTTPSLWHVMPPESPVLLPGFQAFATPETLPPSVTAPHLRPLPSTGITRLPWYYEPLRHPEGPA